MQIDSFTVLFCGLFIKAVLGVLFLAFWLQDRRSVWFGWWGATFFLGCLAALFFMLRGRAPDILTMGVGNAALLAAFACAWQGARVFDRRRPFWSPVVIAPALWLAFCFIPSFMDDVALRIVVSSLMAGPLILMAAYEFWRGRGEPLPSRWPIVALLVSFSLIFLVRVPLVGVLPFPFGALPMHPGWLGVFNLVMFFHTIILTVLMVAMSRERLELDQRTKAQTDPLTGALNRRAFALRGGRLMQRHEHEGEPFCLLCLDLDHFKTLNDRHGHAGGDEVLLRIVSIVHRSIRPTDLLFRLGGEEFCCLLPYTEGGQGVQVAERIRSNIEAATISLPAASVSITVSIGAASTEAFGYDLDVLMCQADLAVYEAKRRGRNRVWEARALPPPAMAAMAAAV